MCWRSHARHSHVFYFLDTVPNEEGGPNFHFREKEKGEAKAKKRAEGKKKEWIGAEFDGRHRFGGGPITHDDRKGELVILRTRSKFNMNSLW